MMELVSHQTASMIDAHLSVEYKRQTVVKVPTVGISKPSSPQIPLNDRKQK